VFEKLQDTRNQHFLIEIAAHISPVLDKLHVHDNVSILRNRLSLKNPREFAKMSSKK
jgi:hypothetical protein